MTCPHCGGKLEAADGPPWICRPCFRGWWNAELTDEARALYRQSHRDFGKGAASRELQRLVGEEAARAETAN